MTGKTFYLSHWYNIPYIKSLKVVMTRQDKYFIKVSPLIL